MSLVLVADDEPAVLDALSGVVEDLGHDVVQAHDGREALDLARRRRPNLVVTDHMMPHLSGLELCRELKQDTRLRDVPVILLSGAITHGTPDATAFLPKPFELSDFERLVNDTLAEERSRSKRVQAAPPHSEDPAAVLSWAAHELRTPLSAARIQLHLLDKALARSGAELKKNPVPSLRRQLFAMETTVGVIADAGELLHGPLHLRRESLSLPEFVNRLVDGWSERYPDFSFERLVPAEELSLELDVNRLNRAMDVLLGNAVKHSGNARVIRVELELQPTHVSIRIIDHGQGIPAERHVEIFRGFRREPGAGVGRGMELYVASEIARAHGGGLTVKSAPGEGAAFTFSIPRG